MNRSELAALAKNAPDLRSALASYFASPEGQRTLSATPVDGVRSAEDAITSLLEEAQGMKTP